jgi:hypothetical protein
MIAEHIYLMVIGIIRKQMLKKLFGAVEVMEENVNHAKVQIGIELNLERIIMSLMAYKSISFEGSKHLIKPKN